MNIIDNELPEGNQLRPPTAAGGPVKTNLLKRIMRKICRRKQTVHLNNDGGCINLNIYVVNNEEIAQLIMDNHGLINY